MRNIKKLAVSLCYLTGLAILLTNQLCAQGLALYPSRLFFHAVPQSTELQTIHITNNGKSDLLLDIQLKDWVRDSLGEKVYSNPGTLAHSNASWVSFSPSQLAVPAGSTQDLSVRLTIPKNGIPFSNSMLFLTQINKQDTVFQKDGSGRSMGFVFRIEMGVHIYNTTATINPVKKLTFEKLTELPSMADSSRIFQVSIKNEGEDMTDATIQFQLTEKTTGKNYNLANRMISMLPGASQLLVFSFPKDLPKGNYQLMLMADAGNNSTLQIAKKQIVYE